MTPLRERACRSSAPVVASLLALLQLACSRGTDSQQTAPAASAGATSAAIASVAGAAPSALPMVSSALPAAPPPGCRALRVSGEAKLGDEPLLPGTLLDGEAWVSLAKDAAASLKHTASGREFSIAGPARFRACRRGREQLLLARGSVTVGSGMGARPGAEVLIATPLAAARYGDAAFTLSVDDKKLAISVKAGKVELDSPLPSQRWKSPLSAKDSVRIPLGKTAPEQLMRGCQEAAQAAEASARHVGDRGAAEPLGERAQQYVKARKKARVACTVAATATGLVADPSASAGLWAEAVRWEGLWENIPRGGLTQAPGK